MASNESYEISEKYNNIEHEKTFEFKIEGIKALIESNAKMEMNSGRVNVGIGNVCLKGKFIMKLNKLKFLIFSGD